jgi:hypothetical protein
MTGDDGAERERTFRLTLTDQNNTLSLDCDVGCLIFLQ